MEVLLDELEAAVDSEIAAPTAKRRGAPTAPPPVAKAPERVLEAKASESAEEPSYAQLARRILAEISQELERGAEGLHGAALHYEAGRLHEYPLNEPREALRHFARARALSKDHVPTLRGERRMRLATKGYRDALSLLEEEARLTPAPAQKAALHRERARLFADVLGQGDEAEVALRTALELDRGDLGVLRALARRAHDAERFEDEERLVGDQIRTVAKDDGLRSTLLVMRARLREDELKDARGAVDLYESALALNPDATEALDALCRLHEQLGRPRDATRVLRAKVARSTDAKQRAAGLYRVAQLEAEALGAEREALEALDQAIAEAGAEATLHETRARLLIRAGRYEEAAAALVARLVEIDDPETRAACLLQLAELEEERLDAPELAATHLGQARELMKNDARASARLITLWTRLERWEDLAHLLEEMANATADPEERASLELRIAGLFDQRLALKGEAIAHCRAALAACPGQGTVGGPTRGAAFEMLTRLLAETHRHEELMTLHREAAESATSDEHAIVHLFRVGQLYEDALGKPAEAVHAYRRILSLSPGDMRAILSLRRAASRANAPRDLLEALELEADLTTDVERAVALILRAGLLLRDELDDASGAIARFRKARDLDGTSARALSELARSYAATGRYEELREVLAKQIALTSAPLEAAEKEFELGEICRDHLGREQDATAAFRRARELSPTHAGALQALMQQARARGDHEELANTLRQAAEASASPKRRAELRLALGEVLEDRLGDLPRAVEAYAAAVKDAAESAIANQALGRVLARLREPPRPAAPADDAARAEASMAMARHLARQPGEEKRAIEALTSALTERPGDVGALLTKAELERRVGDLGGLARSLATLSRVLTEPHARAMALRELAEVQTRRGDDKAAARATWEALLSLQPGDADALDALTRLTLAESDDVTVERTMERLSAMLPAALAAEARVRVAELHEARGDVSGALENFRRALELDAGSLSATWGAYRTAANLGAPAAHAEAARRLAGRVEDKRRAATLWLESATLRGLELHDLEGGAADLDRALTLDPDSEHAADAVDLLLALRPDRKVELLSRAAAAAKVSAHRRDLWLRVGRTQAEALNDRVAALGTLRRALAEDPEHIGTLSALARLESEAGRHADAAARWTRIVERSQDSSTLAHAHLRLAQLYGEALGDPTRARLSLQAVLAFDPVNADGLRRLSKLEAAEGRPAEAAEALQRLIDALGGQPEEQAKVLVELGRMRAAAGDMASRDNAWIAAVSLSGTEGAAARVIANSNPSAELTEREVGAARAWTAAQRSPVEIAHGCLGTARLLTERLHDPARALEVLRAGVEATSGLANLHLAFGQVALEAGRPEQALEAFAHVIEQTPALVAAHRGSAEAFEAMGRGDEATLARQAVQFLENATPSEPVTPNKAQPGSYGPDVLDQLGHLGPAESAAVALLRALGPALSKVHTPDLEAFGLVPRDRLTTRGGEPLRLHADQLAAVLDAGPFDLFVHRLRGRGIALELGATPALMVPATLAELSPARRAFLLAHPLVALARGLGPLERLTPRELEVLLASAARFVDPEFGRGLTNEELLDSERRNLYKALPRRARKVAEEAAQAYVDAGQVDVERLYRRTARTSHRVAALLAGDLVASIRAIVDQHPEWSTLDPTALMHDAAPIRDLVAFWVTAPALHLRRHAGLLPAASP